jgi:hypothetical protein
MATRKIIDYSDFSGGEYGILEPWRAPQGTWTGKNIVKYDNGSLGPRNGLKKITLSGDTTNFLGTIISTGAYSRRTDSALWALLDNSGTRKAFTITRAGVIDELTLTDAVPAATEPISSLVYEDIEYLTIVSNSIYKITGGAFEQVDDTPGCRAFCQYGDRFFAGGGDTGGVPKGPDGVTCSANRLWYSSPTDPTDWPLLNYIDVTGAIVGLFPQRTHLVIVTTEGWWVLTGVPGITDTLRRPSKSEFPTWPTQGTVLEPSCNLAFVHGSLQQRNGEAEGEIATHSLGRFTGTTIEYATHLPFGSGENYTTYPPTYSAVTLRGPEDWLVQGGLDTAPNRAVFYRSGGWQKIEWQISGVTLLGWCITMRRTDVHQFWANGSAGVAPKLYEWQAYNNRPAFTADTKKGPGDDSSTPFTAEITLPEYHEDDGRNVGIVDVVVDFTSWSTGSGSTNHFDLVPTVFRTFGDAAQAATTWSFDEAGASSATTLAGTRRRKRFPVVGRDLEGSGFQLKFQNIRGVAINRVQVYGDVDGPRVGE